MPNEKIQNLGSEIVCLCSNAEYTFYMCRCVLLRPLALRGSTSHALTHEAFDFETGLCGGE